MTRAVPTTAALIDTIEPERRVLDPSCEAIVRHYDGGFAVTAGEGRLGPMPHDAAYASAHLHNTIYGHVPPIDRRQS